MRKNKKEINTKSKVYALNDAKGVTLMTLVVTIIVLLILGSIVTYSGIEAMNNTKRTKFVTELKIMQSYVNKWYEEWKNDNPSNPPGVNLGHTDEDSFRRSIRIHFWNDEKEITSVEGKSDYRTRLVDLNISNFSDYYFISREKIKSFGIEEVSQDLLVSVIDRKVISYEGLKDNGKMYYTIDSLEGVKGFDTIYNVDYTDKNSSNDVGFSVDYSYLGDGKTKVTISNITYGGDNQKWKVKYRVDNGNWQTSGNLSFIIDEYGQYQIGLYNPSISENIIGNLATITINMKVPQVGDTVNYAPSGTYSWDKAFAESTKTSVSSGTVTLSSASGETYNITQWKVLNYDIPTDTAELVPTAPVGSLKLQGAQGYNNSVKMLNDACSSLYSNSAKGITARSIKEEDFVKAGKQSQEGDSEKVNDWTRMRDIYSNGTATYNNRLSSAYSRGNSWYPNIHANEFGNGLNNNVILGLSEQTGSLIEKIINNVENAQFQPTSGGIQPLQTYYNSSNYNTTSSKLNSSKANVLLPNKNSTNYWLASRSVKLTNNNYCDFIVRIIGSGSLGASNLYNSGGYSNNHSYAVFPVVSAKIDVFQPNATANTWDINI